MNKNFTIKSFLVDHTKIEKGIYISRIDKEIVTYDIRFIKPNTPPYLDGASAHTIEHLLATYLRNSQLSEHIIYVGPMGCRTGFYLLVRDLSGKQTINIINDALKFILNFEGEIPGASKKECGNYLEHDLEGAKSHVKNLLEAVSNWNENQLNY